MGKIGRDVGELKSAPRRADRGRQAPPYARAGTVESKDISVFKTGMKVEHSRFGIGVITEITGENAKIKFDTLGVKMFNMRLAPIKPVE